jgi:hypothetical protein
MFLEDRQLYLCWYGTIRYPPWFLFFVVYCDHVFVCYGQKSELGEARLSLSSWACFVFSFSGMHVSQFERTYIQCSLPPGMGFGSRRIPKELCMSLCLCGREKERRHAMMNDSEKSSYYSITSLAAYKVPYNEYLVEIPGSLACSRDYLYWFSRSESGLYR